jgi:hypothetical protein
VKAAPDPDLRIDRIPQPARTLHQRICAVSGALGPVERGSQNQYRKPAVGIDDLEEALGPLLAEHGIVTEWSYGRPPFSPDDQPLRHLEMQGQDGTYGLWMAHLRCRLVNADDPADATDWADWWDIGSNPMAATSFARKGFLKAVFHVAAAEDEGQPARQERQDRPTAPTTAPRGPKRLAVPNRACGDCGDGLVVVYGQRGSFIGHATYPSTCKSRVDEALRTQYIAEAEAAETHAPTEPTTLVELVAAAQNRLRDLVAFDEDAARVILTEVGHWPGQPKAIEWLRTLSDRGLVLRILSELNRAIADSGQEIPT